MCFRQLSLHPNAPKSQGLGRIPYPNFSKFGPLFESKSDPNFEKFPKVDRVWGDLKSKYQQKTSFLKRSRLDLCNKKDLKTFYQKLLKLRTHISAKKVLFGVTSFRFPLNCKQIQVQVFMVHQPPNSLDTPIALKIGLVQLLVVLCDTHCSHDRMIIISS